MSWKPIETAPTDRPFIAAMILYDDKEGYWIEGIEWLSGSLDKDGKRWNQNSGNRTSWAATHWMETPEPPDGKH